MDTWNSGMKIWSILLLIMVETSKAAIRPPRTDIGVPAGFIPDCPGVMKNATISNKMMQELKVVLQRFRNGYSYRKPMPVTSAAKQIAKDKYVDLKNKKTVLYAVGFWDSSVMPPSVAIGNAYSKRGYNVFVSETFSFLTNIYPKSVRLSRTIGRKLGEFLVQLSQMGMPPENLELIGISLGAHIVSYAAKYYYQVTGRKPWKLVGLDPAGPCFRSLNIEERFSPDDAENVVVLHTNIDGFGMAEPVGHVDFYANGGEYQPGDIPYIPCLVICSHVKAILYWWQALEHPKKFIGMQCDSVQEARYADCYSTKVTNYIGLETNFSRPGIFYLSTSNEFPYYRGRDGLKPENEIYTSIVRSINAEDVLLV